MFSIVFVTIPQTDSKYNDYCESNCECEALFQRKFRKPHFRFVCLFSIGSALTYQYQALIYIRRCKFVLKIYKTKRNTIFDKKISQISGDNWIKRTLYGRSKLKL